MLVFEFQMLHPVTFASFFSLTSQTAPSAKGDGCGGFILKKLVCSSVSVPFSAVLVNFKCDFFREPTAILEDMTPMDPAYAPALQQLPLKPQGIAATEIHSQINF